MIYDNYYTSVEVAKLLGKSRQHVWNNRKKFKAIRAGRDWLYPKNQFKDVMLFDGKVHHLRKRDL